MQRTAALPWHKQFWPWFLVVLPTAAVIASFVTLGIAIAHRDSLVRDNYYKEGLAINARLDEDKVAAARHIGVRGRIDGRALTIELSGDFGTPPAVLMLQFMHPLLDRRDFSIALQRDAAGRYSATLPLALRGRWHVEVGAPDDKQWRLRGAIDTDRLSAFALRP